MITIQKASVADAGLLTGLALKSFKETHEQGVPADALAFYMSTKLTVPVFTKELEDGRNSFHFIYYNDELAGYSKIILNNTYPAIKETAVTKLERLYLLKAYHDLKLGAALFSFVTNLSKNAGQTGIWLYVWKINERAIKFYTKAGFVIIGEEDFKISETHSNPNYIMYLNYSTVG